MQGWLSISLVTSSLLKAVGLGGSATGAAAAGAAIKWITKDGAGSIGRLVVGPAPQACLVLCQAPHWYLSSTFKSIKVPWSPPAVFPWGPAPDIPSMPILPLHRDGPMGCC